MTFNKHYATENFHLIDTKPEIPKKQIFVFGSIIASTASLVALGLISYLQYLHNPSFHSLIQSKGIFL